MQGRMLAKRAAQPAAFEPHVCQSDVCTYASAHAVSNACAKCRPKSESDTLADRKSNADAYKGSNKEPDGSTHSEPNFCALSIADKRPHCFPDCDTNCNANAVANACAHTCAANAAANSKPDIDANCTTNTGTNTTSVRYRDTWVR